MKTQDTHAAQAAGNALMLADQIEREAQFLTRFEAELLEAAILAHAALLAPDIVSDIIIKALQDGIEPRVIIEMLKPVLTPEANHARLYLRGLAAALSDVTNRKSVGGKSYVQVNGGWFQE